MAKKIINIRLEELIWKDAKLGAVGQGVTLQDWLTEAIQEKLDKVSQDKYDLRYSKGVENDRT